MGSMNVSKNSVITLLRRGVLLTGVAVLAFSVVILPSNAYALDDPSLVSQDRPPTINGQHTYLGSYHVGDTVIYDLDSQINTSFPESRPLSYSNLSIDDSEQIYSYEPVYDANGIFLNYREAYYAKPIYGEASFITLQNGNKGLKYTSRLYQQISNNVKAKDSIRFSVTDSFGKKADFRFTVDTVSNDVTARQNFMINSLTVDRGSTPAQPASQPAEPPTPMLTTTANNANVTIGQFIDTTVTINSTVAIEHPNVSVRVNYPDYYNDSRDASSQPFASDTLFIDPSDINPYFKSDRVNYVSPQSIPAGISTFTVRWKPTVAGLHKVQVGVSSHNDVIQYAYNSDIGRISVTDTVAPSVPPVATTPTQPSRPKTPSTTKPLIITSTAKTSNVAVGKKALTRLAVRSNAVVKAAIINVEIFDAEGQRVNQTFYENKDISVGNNPYTIQWSPPKAGTYYIRAGVFTEGWQKTLNWNDNAGSATIIE